MNKNLVVYRPFDAMHVAVKDATHKVSFDGGGTWSTLNANEKKNGFEVQFDIPFIARVEKIGRWPVEALMVVRDYSGDYSGPPKLEKFADRSNFDELGIPEDFGVHSFHSHSAGGGIWSHVLTVSLTLFRDAKYEARNNGLNDPPLNSYKHDILSFAGERVLSEKSKDKSGLERFAALMEKSVVDHDRKSRSLLMAIAPPTGADSFPRVSPGGDEEGKRERHWRNARGAALLWVRPDFVQVIGIDLDSKVKSPPSGYACLPDIIDFAILLGAQGGVAEILEQHQMFPATYASAMPSRAGRRSG